MVSSLSEAYSLIFLTFSIKKNKKKQRGEEEEWREKEDIYFSL